VRTERQGFIEIMENLVRDTFEMKFGNGEVGVKMFGSMATELAIETSDVDLVVTGVTQTGSGKQQVLKMMAILNAGLETLQEKG